MNNKKESNATDNRRKIISKKYHNLDDYEVFTDKNMYIEYSNELSLKPDFNAKNKLRSNIIFKKYSYNLMLHELEEEYPFNNKDVSFDYYKTIYKWIEYIYLQNNKNEIDSSFWNIFNYIKSNNTILDSMIFGFIQAQTLYRDKGPLNIHKNFKYKSFNLLPCRILDYSKDSIKFDTFGVIESSLIKPDIMDHINVIKIERNLKTELYFIKFGRIIYK